MRLVLLSMVFGAELKKEDSISSIIAILLTDPCHGRFYFNLITHLARRGSENNKKRPDSQPLSFQSYFSSLYTLLTERKLCGLWERRQMAERRETFARIDRAIEPLITVAKFGSNPFSYAMGALSFAS